MEDYDLDAYLGDVEVTDDQRERIMREADRIAERFPQDPDDPDGDDGAAFTAAIMYILGDLTPEDVGSELRAARLAEADALTRARQIAVMAVEDGASEAGTARALGVDRMAVRGWLGKR